MIAILLLLGFLGGLVTGVSPCILPVLPVIFATGTDAGAHSGRLTSAPVEPTVGDQQGVGPLDADPGSPSGSVGQHLPPSTPRKRRPVVVVGGLVASFSVVTLLGSWVLGALGLPDGTFRWLGLAVITVLGLSLMIPALGEIVERPFARLSAGGPITSRGDLVLGGSLGLVFVPCAGPVLATITVVGGTHRIGFDAVILTAAFAVGVAVPLLAFAYAGRYVGGHVRSLRTHAALVRQVVGGILVVTALVLALGAADGLQRAVPGYSDALQKHLTGNSVAQRDLKQVAGEATSGSLANCTPDSPVLERCGAVPAFTGITAWLNTPGGRGLTTADLKGKVVLVDFWTYSCINCQRSLPHVEAWNAAYAPLGLTVVGVHTPEFAFEHDVTNVRSAIAQLGVRYPVAVDNNIATWNAFDNSYWPAEYLIDANGEVRHLAIGEGGYSQTETLIRELLKAAHPNVVLPPQTDVPDKTPTTALTPESYLGYHYGDQNLWGEEVTPDVATVYSETPGQPPNTFAFGGTWTIGSEAAVAGPGASLTLRFQARDVYLVLGGSGTVVVTQDGGPPRTIAVTGIPRLYTLAGPQSFGSGTLVIRPSPGVRAFDFTFG